jgi:hypothetical protein
MRKHATFYLSDQDRRRVVRMALQDDDPNSAGDIGGESLKSNQVRVKNQGVEKQIEVDDPSWSTPVMVSFEANSSYVNSLSDAIERSTTIKNVSTLAYAEGQPSEPRSPSRRRQRSDTVGSALYRLAQYRTALLVVMNPNDD